jgi:phage recombination protein Bet
MNTALASTEQRSLVSKLADRFGVEHNKLLTTLKATAFRQSEGKEVSNEQMMALLIVADQYGLNPFTKEIFAFDDKHKGIVPVVSVDGWSRIINEHPQYDGVEFRYADKMVTMPGGKPCPEWCEAVFARKDRSNPIVVREYLDEVYIGPRGNPPKPGPWQTHTKRFLRHKTFIQGGRIAFGFGGIHDEDEAYRIIDGQAQRVEVMPRADVADLQSRLVQRAAIEHAPDVEPAPDSSKLRGRIFVAETKAELDALAEEIGALPNGADKDEVNELYLRRSEEVEAK